MSQFQNPALGPYVKNFNLIFLDIALTREPDLDTYGPQMLHGISKISQSGLKGYFPILMRALARWHFDYSSANFEQKLGLDEEDVRTLARLFENLVYYDGTSSSSPPPPAYISKEGFPHLQALSASKLAAAKLTRAALGKEGVLTLLIGSKDGDYGVADFCRDAIKRIGVDYEDENFVRRLYDFYFLKPRVNVEVTILESLSKSVLAANTMPQMLKLVENVFSGIPFGNTL